jgi:hypothetical protein
MTHMMATRIFNARGRARLAALPIAAMAIILAVTALPIAALVMAAMVAVIKVTALDVAAMAHSQQSCNPTHRSHGGH